MEQENKGSVASWRFGNSAPASGFIGNVKMEVLGFPGGVWGWVRF